ncbi:hypothetical protein IQ07DRAFT_644629 [Pyrenochaeta sp. DS3sAY3a]|nr:hypothetical protein IQ07DRAFT_644629 [Pyrenochaeta sp. DS3sAY3a]
MPVVGQGPKKMDLLRGPTFKITTRRGEDTATWNVPIALLVEHSAYFRQVHEGSIQTDPPNEISFHDYTPEVFQSFLCYIHSKALAVSEPQPPALGSLIASWLFGDAIFSVGFKNHAMKFIYNKYALKGVTLGGLNARHWIRIWERSNTITCLQSFVVDTIARNWVYKNYEQEDIDAWHIVMNNNPNFRRKVMDAIAGIGTEDSRGRNPKPLEAYLEKPEDTTNTAKRARTEGAGDQASNTESENNKVARLE